MKNILKWTGGKTSEIEIIKPLFPKNFDRYIEPFLGGGAVYFDLENNKNIVNDYNKELITFYKILNNNNSYLIMKSFIEKEQSYRNNIINVKLLKNEDNNEIEIDYQIINSLIKNNNYLKKELNNKEKLIKTNKINKLKEQEKIIKTACMASLYYNCRDIYNKLNLKKSFNAEHIAYWFIMRELSYSGMFRYAKNGNFNVPYGGQSYNSKNLNEKLLNIEKIRKTSFYKNTEFNNLDFKDFFQKYNNFNQNDFIFLDPPYDSDFSQYNQEKDFTKENQIELRDLLLITKAKIMVVIKETDFILDLYKKDFKIIKFDKNYSVNFKNRNDKQVKHLIITNY